MATQRELDEQWVTYCNAQDCADRAAEANQPWAAELQLVANTQLAIYNGMQHLKAGQAYQVDGFYQTLSEMV